MSHKTKKSKYENKTVKKTNQKDRVYCQEPYAQSLYNKIVGVLPDFMYKDLEIGDIVPITTVRLNEDETIAYAETAGSINIEIPISTKELEFLKYNLPYSFNDSNSVTSLGWFGWAGTVPVPITLSVMITQTTPSFIGSFYESHIRLLRERFMNDIQEQKNWYVAYILNRNNGGYIANIGGIETFLPGSLAAPNKIVDFDQYLGKHIRVMIETYLPEIDTFVISNKKYIQKILPYEISKLDKQRQYIGKITGTSQYGIFLEFDDIFTGLLHVSEMTQETYALYKANYFEPGYEMEFWIMDIRNNRIILSDYYYEEHKKENNKPTSVSSEQLLEIHS